MVYKLRRVSAAGTSCWIAAGAARCSPHAGEDGNDIRITIREIVECDDKSLRMDGVDPDQFTAKRLAAK